MIDIFTGKRTLYLDIDEKNLLFCTQKHDISPDFDEQRIIEEALDHPIDAAPLEEVPKDAKVVIMVDDCTRPTPTAKLIPSVVRRLEGRTHNLTFMTAPGTHRPLTDTELEEKIGKEYLSRYPVVNVDYKRHEDYEYIGDTEMGTPLHIHKEFLKADYKIALGNIGPHNVVGWSGGAKIVQPGISGEETTSKTHIAGSYYPVREVYGNINCRMRQEVDDIGRRVGLDFIVNTVLDSDRTILGLFCGHYLKAHRAGVKFAEQQLCPVIPELADIVVVSAYPCNMDYWQGFKPLGFSTKGVKKDGTIVYILDSKEGFCGNSPAHRDMLYKYLKTNEATIRADVAAGKVQDLVGVTNPLCHFQVLDYVKNVICVTDSLTPEECELLSFTYADSLETAMRLAFQTQGEDAKVGVIRCGGETLVRVKE